jgi:hypothetical protein
MFYEPASGLMNVTLITSLISAVAPIIIEYKKLDLAHVSSRRTIKFHRKQGDQMS